MSNWWPEGYLDSAFQVQRQTYGVVEGGDYVRGSTVETLPRTALRYGSLAPEATSAQNRSLLSVRAFDYHTAEIAFGWPDGSTEMLEVTLVRSGFGVPSTVNDGQTVFKASIEDFETEIGEGVELSTPPVIFDRPLPSGRWYYYGLFFKINATTWRRYMADSVLIPRNHHHAEHLWEGIPPYYRWNDDNYRVGSGFLRQFLLPFGFELDTTREYVESWQQLHNTDFAPMSLLKRLGDNYGVPYEAGIGDIRYRALLANISHLYAIRGTTKCLQGIIEAMSKYECDITEGTNVMLLPDDSDFYFGTGNWAGLHAGTVMTGELGAVVPPGEILITSPAGVVPPASFGRGVMRVQSIAANETVPMMITVGDGTLGSRTIIPLYAGIPVESGDVYGFSVQIRFEIPATVKPYMLWFTAGGQPADLLGWSEGLPVTPADGLWHPYTMQSTVPANAVYLVPALYITNRLAGGASVTHSGWMDMAGATVYNLSSDGSVTATAPDRYLTVGDPGEPIGAPSISPPFDGFLIGSADN